MNTRDVTACLSIRSLMGRTVAKSRKARARMRRPTLENLEHRELLSGIIQYPLGTTSTSSFGITSSRNGSLYMAETNSAIAEVSTAGALIKEFALPNDGSIPAFALDLASDRNGNIWFTTTGGGGTPTGGVKGAIGMLARSSGNVTYYDTTSPDLSGAITIGPDGNPWFSETGKLGTIDPTAPVSTAVKEFDVAGSANTNTVQSISAGPALPNGDGTIYLTASTNLLQFDVTKGTFAPPIALPQQQSAGSIVKSLDGKTLWIGLVGSGSTIAGLDQFDPATQTFTPHLFTTATYSLVDGPLVLAPDINHNVWFTDGTTGKIGEFDTTTQSYSALGPLSTGGQGAYITGGLDGNLWFSASQTGAIGQVVLGSTVPTTADISITAVPLTGTYAWGDSPTYHLTVANAGPAPATTLIVNVFLPSNTSYSGPQGGIHDVQWNQSTNTVSYTIFSLASGAQADVPIQVTTTGLGAQNSLVTDPNSAYGAAPRANVGGSVTDPNTGDNTVRLPVLNVVSATPDLVISGTVSPTTVNTNDVVDYFLTVTNNGNSVASNVVVSETLPKGFVYVGSTDPTSGFAWNSSTSTVTYTVGSLFPQKSISPTFPVESPVAGTFGVSPFMITATVKSDVTDPTPGDNTFTSPTIIVKSTATNTADLVVVAGVPSTTAHPFQLITYQIGLANAGPAVATNVNVSFLTPAGVGFDSVSPGSILTYPLNAFRLVTYHFNSLPVGAASPITFRLSATTVGTVPGFKVIVSSDNDNNPGNNTSTFAAVSIVSPVVVVSKVNEQTSVALNKQNRAILTDTVLITNTGTTTATGYTFRAGMPIGATKFVGSFVPSSPKDPKFSAPVSDLLAKTITVSLPAILPGKSIKITFTGTVSESAFKYGSATSSATVADSTASTGSSSVDYQTTLQAPPPPPAKKSDVSLKLTNGTTSVTLNSDKQGSLFYTFQITNNTASPISNDTFTDTLPALVTQMFASATPVDPKAPRIILTQDSRGKNILTWTNFTIPSHSSITLFVAAVASDKTPTTKGNVTNVATLKHGSLSVPNVSITTKVIPPVVVLPTVVDLLNTTIGKTINTAILENIPKAVGSGLTSATLLTQPPANPPKLTVLSGNRVTKTISGVVTATYATLIGNLDVVVSISSSINAKTASEISVHLGSATDAMAYDSYISAANLATIQKNLLQLINKNQAILTKALA